MKKEVRLCISNSAMAKMMIVSPKNKKRLGRLRFNLKQALFAINRELRRTPIPKDFKILSSECKYHF